MEKVHILTMKVARSQIFALVAIVESYEQIGVVRVIDVKRGIVQIYSTPDFIGPLGELLQSLDSEGLFVELLED